MNGLTCKSCAHSESRPTQQECVLMCVKKEEEAKDICDQFQYEPGTSPMEWE